MKNFFYLICLAAVCQSCSSTKGVSAANHPRKRYASPDPKFLEIITVRPPGASAYPVLHKPSEINANKDFPGASYPSDIEKCNELQFKYAILMEEEVESITNEKLISFLEEWYGIPYKYGGGTRMGVDCSAFSCMMMDSVYNLNIPRTCREQFVAGKRIKQDQLLQGDLVFFNTTGGVSHVGVYLGHRKFVHASTSNGVMISGLDDGYFKKRYVGSSRIR